jgi:hypothetical protein
MSGEIVKDFRDLICIFTQWEKLIQEEIGPLVVIEDERIIEKQKQSLTKFSQNQLSYLRQEIERIFLTNFHRDRMKKMQKYLEDDGWATADISFEYYEILYYLLNLRDEDKYNIDTTLDESLLYNNSFVFDRKNNRTSSFNLQ